MQGETKVIAIPNKLYGDGTNGVYCSRKPKIAISAPVFMKVDSNFALTIQPGFDKRYQKDFFITLTRYDADNSSVKRE